MPVAAPHSGARELPSPPGIGRSVAVVDRGVRVREVAGALSRHLGHYTSRSCTEGQQPPVRGDDNTPETCRR